MDTLQKQGLFFIFFDIIAISYCLHYLPSFQITIDQYKIIQLNLTNRDYNTTVQDVMNHRNITQEIKYVSNMIQSWTLTLYSFYLVIFYFSAKLSMDLARMKYENVPLDPVTKFIQDVVIKLKH